MDPVFSLECFYPLKSPVVWKEMCKYHGSKQKRQWVGVGTLTRTVSSWAPGLAVPTPHVPHQSLRSMWFLSGSGF